MKRQAALAAAFVILYRQDMTDALKSAIKAAGGTIKLAAHLGITRQAVEQWTCVPAERVLAVERFTGVSRYQLRPDIYGPPPTTPKVRAAYQPAV